MHDGSLMRVPRAAIGAHNPRANTQGAEVVRHQVGGGGRVVARELLAQPSVIEGYLVSQLAWGLPYAS